ncbi:MAG: hypothetical protein MHM6MM_005768 [Cercozoa sp. M6MM]
MYESNQPRFLNAVVCVDTTLPPMELLLSAKQIEAELGRQASARNGPRQIDVDIVAFEDGARFSSPHSGHSGHSDRSDEQLGREMPLEVPHPRACERSFVRRPLQELLRSVYGLDDSAAAQRVDELVGTAPADYSIEEESSMQTVLSLGSTVLMQGGTPLIMGIVNCTPDSFSDGGLCLDRDAAVRHARQLLEAGADILDIGGLSTRPGADFGSAQLERDRVLPVIESIRREHATVPVSVDTFRPSVARAAFEAGATLLNDVSGGTGHTWDTTEHETMFQVAARCGAPLCVMHTRGSPQQMALNAHYDDVVTDVRTELQAHLDEAQREGVPAWNLIADVGIGFAKNARHNWQLCRELEAAHPASFASLFGPSRKRFLASALQDAGCGTDNAQRDLATASLIGSLPFTPSIVRVHNVATTRAALVVRRMLRQLP